MFVALIKRHKVNTHNRTSMFNLLHEVPGCTVVPSTPHRAEANSVTLFSSGFVAGSTSLRLKKIGVNQKDGFKLKIFGEFEMDCEGVTGT